MLIISLLGISFVLIAGFFPAFALTELERVTIEDPRLENAFGAPLGSNINVDQQIQISVDVINNQERSQNFIYLVQIKNEQNFVVTLGWISGQLTPDQKFSPSLSWIPKDAGEFTAEIFVWEGFPVNPKALSEYTIMKIYVS